MKTQKRGFEIYTSDFDRHTIETIEKCYPNFQQAFIGEIFIPKQGWVKVLMKITEAKIMELFGWGVTHVNLEVTNEFGQTCYPDYAIREFFV